MNNQIISVNDVKINVVAHESTFLVSNKEVALAFGVGEDAIYKHKQRSNEFTESKHFTLVDNLSNGQKQTMWTKRGIIRLGFKLRETPQTISFRDWAEDFIINGEEQQIKLPQTPMEIMEVMFIGMKDQSKQIEEVQNDVKELKTSSTLDYSQQQRIQKQVAIKVSVLKANHNLASDVGKKLFAGIYRALKSTFEVGSYKDIAKVKFNEAIALIDRLAINQILSY